MYTEFWRNHLGDWRKWKVC